MSTIRDWIVPAGHAQDTGMQPVIAVGERLRIKVLPGQGECRGRLYVYVKE